MLIFAKTTWWTPSTYYIIALFKKRFYLFISRERGRKGEREGETSMCGCLSCAPYWGPTPQPSHVPWLGIKLVTFPFTGWCPNHWATPVRDSVLCYEERSHVENRRERLRWNGWCYKKPEQGGELGVQVITSEGAGPVSYTHLTLPTSLAECRSRWSPYQ